MNETIELGFTWSRLDTQVKGLFEPITNAICKQVGKKEKKQIATN